jgi:anti-anti-sigma factor
MDEMTIRCDVTGPLTVLRISGRVDALRCGLLRETLEMAAALRPDCPLLVDLGGVSFLGPAAQACLAWAQRQSRQSNRRLTLRNVPAAAGGTLAPRRPRCTALVRA